MARGFLASPSSEMRSAWAFTEVADTPNSLAIVQQSPFAPLREAWLRPSLSTVFGLRRAVVNTYGEKEAPRGVITGGPKLSSSKLTEGFPVRGKQDPTRFPRPDAQ
jgi:hypothetical protein